MTELHRVFYRTLPEMMTAAGRTPDHTVGAATQGTFAQIFNLEQPSEPPILDWVSQEKPQREIPIGTGNNRDTAAAMALGAKTPAEKRAIKALIKDFQKENPPYKPNFYTEVDKKVAEVLGTDSIQEDVADFPSQLIPFENLEETPEIVDVDNQEYDDETEDPFVARLQKFEQKRKMELRKHDADEPLIHPHLNEDRNIASEIQVSYDTLLAKQIPAAKAFIAALIQPQDEKTETKLIYAAIATGGVLELRHGAKHHLIEMSTLKSVLKTNTNDTVDVVEPTGPISMMKLVLTLNRLSVNDTKPSLPIDCGSYIKPAVKMSKDAA